MVEYVSANPTGPLHLGHGRGAALGDTLCRILAFRGNEVVREFYINDAGLQVKLLGESIYSRFLDRRFLSITRSCPYKAVILLSKILVKLFNNGAWLLGIIGRDETFFGSGDRTDSSRPNAIYYKDSSIFKAID